MAKMKKDMIWFAVIVVLSAIGMKVFVLQLEKRGAKAATVVSSEKERGSEKIARPKKLIIPMRVTAYCPCKKCCGKWADGTTASGYKIQPGDVLVAADKRYPFGTRMIIPGYADNQPVKVLDRGGSIKGNRLDVFFHTHQEALEWGVKENVPVEILK